MGLSDELNLKQADYRRDGDSSCNCKDFDSYLDACANNVKNINDLRHLFTVMLQYAFSNPKLLSNYKSELACLAGDRKTNPQAIQVTAGTAIDIGDTQNVPAVRVAMGKVEYKNEATNPISSRSMDHSASVLSYECKTSVIITCRHNDADVCAYIQEFVVMFLISRYPWLMNNFNAGNLGWLRDYYPISTTEPEMKNQEDDQTIYWYETTCEFGIEFVYSLTVRQESKRLKDFKIVVDENLAQA